MHRMCLLSTALVMVFTITTTSTAQDCQSCTTGSAATFGYPTTGSQCGHGLGFVHEAKARMHGYIDMAENAYHRNQAWPKPFECWDRQSYFGMWGPMYYRGLENHCTLTDMHFDADTNELNSAGKQKIANIMRNLPSAARQIFVFQSGNQETADARIAEVEQQVGDWFGHLGAPVVATTTNPFYGQAGALASQINEQFIQSLPAPTVPTGSGGGGGAGAGGGQ